MASNPPDPSDTLTRFGRDAETVERLSEQVARAEMVIGVHSVSVRLNTNRRGKQAYFTDVIATFPGTKQTGADPQHYTVVLPKPVTEDVADKFNTLFPPKEIP